MVVTWSTINSSNFKWQHVETRREAEIWLQRQADQEGWHNGKGYGIYTELEATKLVYPNGKKVVDYHVNESKPEYNPFQESRNRIKAQRELLEYAKGKIK